MPEIVGTTNNKSVNPFGGVEVEDLCIGIEEVVEDQEDTQDDLVLRVHQDTLNEYELETKRLKSELSVLIDEKNTLNRTLLEIDSQKKALEVSNKKLQEDIKMKELEENERLASEAKELISKLKSMVSIDTPEDVRSAIYDGCKQIFAKFCPVGDVEMLTAIIDRFSEKGIKPKD